MPMLNMPQRQTLTRQTVDALREGMATGIWKDFLPGERELCSLLQVSRPTLRTSLQIVQREGLIHVKQGKRSTILKKRRVLRPGKPAVAIVSKLPLYSMSRNRIFLIDYMSKVLQERGLRLEIVSHPGFGTNRPGRAIQQLRERGDFRAFVLVMSSQAVQQWFCDNSLPAIALGSTFSGLPMPSVDADYQAVGRHAAGLLLGTGHRRIAWMIPEANHAGDLDTEKSFLKSLQQSGDPAVQCRIIRYGFSSQDLTQKINALLSSATPPTAFFVINAFATATLVTQLLSRGLEIPRDVSVIARDYDPILDWIQPPIAHYISPLQRIASRISRMAVELATDGPFPLRHVRVIPQFCKAESLSVSPESASQPRQLVVQ
jgi:LacI family transcriptional regulator